MECSCIVDIYNDDGERVELYSRTNHKANKTHRCCECHREIQKGENYQIEKYLYGGKFYKDKTCADCMSAANIFYPRGGYQVESLWDEISNAVDADDGEIPESCIIELTPTAKNKLLDMIERYFNKYAK